MSLQEVLEELLLLEVQELLSQSQKRRRRTKTWDSPSSIKLLCRLTFLEWRYIYLSIHVREHIYTRWSCPPHANDVRACVPHPSIFVVCFCKMSFSETEVSPFPTTDTSKLHRSFLF